MNKNRIENDDVVYSEWVRQSTLIILLISLVLVILVSTAISTSLLEPQSSALTLSLCITLSVFFIFIGINFRGIQITITKDIIEVKYGWLSKKTFVIKDLESCEVTEASFKNYIGIGVRIGFDSSLAFTTRFGEAVKLTNQDDRSFVFTTNNGQEICDVLAKYIEKKVEMDSKIHNH